MDFLVTSFLPFLESFSLQVLLLRIHNIKFTPSSTSGSDSPCTNSKLILITRHPHPLLNQIYLFMSPKRNKSRPIYLPSQNSFANFSILSKYRRRRRHRVNHPQLTSSIQSPSSSSSSSVPLFPIIPITTISPPPSNCAFHGHP